MKFPDTGESRLEHFDIGFRCDRLDIVGVPALDEAVHLVAPGPKAVGSVTPEFGEAGHAALEGVAVQVRNAGKADRMALVAGLGGSGCLDAKHAAGTGR